MRVKSTIILLFFIPALFAQRNIDFKQRSTFTYSKYNVYAFVDLVRFAGLGAEYRVNLFYGIDLKLGAIYPNGIFSSNSSASDYFNTTGVSAMITPKLYMGSKRHFFIGMNGAFSLYGYKNKWESSSLDFGSPGGDKELRDRHISSFAFGPTMGFYTNIDNVVLEFFAGLGAELTTNKVTVYQTAANANYPFYPYTYHKDVSQVNVLAGVKIGFGFKQKRQVSRRYYDVLLRQSFKNDNRRVIESYRNREISRAQLREYYNFTRKQYYKIKQEYNKYYEDSVYLNKVVKDAQKTVREYFQHDYKKKP